MSARSATASAGHRYRVVAVYDNPTCVPASGAMGVLVAVFAPDDMTRWPAVDTTDASYQKDLAWLMEVNGGDAGEAHRHESAVPAAAELTPTVGVSCSGRGSPSTVATYTP